MANWQRDGFAILPCNPMRCQTKCAAPSEHPLTVPPILAGAVQRGPAAAANEAPIPVGAAAACPSPLLLQPIFQVAPRRRLWYAHCSRRQQTCLTQLTNQSHRTAQLHTEVTQQQTACENPFSRQYSSSAAHLSWGPAGRQPPAGTPSGSGGQPAPAAPPPGCLSPPPPAATPPPPCTPNSEEERGREVRKEGGHQAPATGGAAAARDERGFLLHVADCRLPAAASTASAAASGSGPCVGGLRTRCACRQPA